VRRQRLQAGRFGGRKRVLLVGGSLNQTRIAHAVASHLTDDYDCWFSPCYMDSGLIGVLNRRDLLEWTALGGVMRRQTLEYLQEHGLRIDDGGRLQPYDLVVTTTDLVVPKNIRHLPIVLLQEGMTDPENALYSTVRRLRLPRYLASTASFGLSDAYRYLCCASEGYKHHFEGKGIPGSRIVVTGLPNWDDLARQAFNNNTFPLRGYVLVATSDARETFKVDRRRRFLRTCVEIAAGRPLVFKLHPNEMADRAIREIREVVGDAPVYVDGDVNQMISHCEALITQYSTVIYTGLALGKEVHSYFDVEHLRRLMPIQNEGRSAAAMAAVCRHVLDPSTASRERSELTDVCQCRDCRAGAHRLHAPAG